MAMAIVLLNGLDRVILEHGLPAFEIAGSPVAVRLAYIHFSVPGKFREYLLNRPCRRIIRVDQQRNVLRL
jgi:hypothetical protein